MSSLFDIHEVISVLMIFWGETRWYHSPRCLQESPT